MTKKQRMTKIPNDKEIANDKNAEWQKHRKPKGESIIIRVNNKKAEWQRKRMT